MVVGQVGLWVLVCSSGLGLLLLAAPRDESQTVFGRRLQSAAVAGAGLALFSLVSGFLNSNWSSRYVADHTRSGLSPFLRLAGLWAGPEGSLLLFTAGIAAIALLATRAAHDQPLAVQRSTQLVGGAITFGFAVVLALTASPFQRLPAPAVDGLGLQPVLEHPAMVWHPPILYAGLVGMLLPSIRAAGILLGRNVLDGQITRAMLALPSALLGAGLITGARWAHVELGWGGYWAWDPIESAGLVAWLAAVTGLHLRRATQPRVFAAAVLLPGVAAIWATTLTRVGLVDSVHAFADRPALRVGLLIVATLASFLLLVPIVVAQRGPGADETSGRKRAAGILSVATLIVAIGTYEPLVEAGVGGDALSIAGWYFTRVLWPVIIVGAVALMVAEQARWWPVVGAAIGVALTPVAAGPFGLAVAAAGGATVAAVIGSRGRVAGRLAHVGVGIFLIGVAGTMASTVDRVVLFADQPVEIADATLVYRGIDLVEGAVQSAAIANVDVDGQRYTPQLIRHERRGVSTAEVVTIVGVKSELQLVLLDAGGSSADFRVVSHPRMLMVWLGAAIVILGLVARRGQSFRLSRLRLRSSSSVEAPLVSADSGGATGG